MRILITGGTGFLGSHLCRRMLQDGHEVRVLSRLTSSPTALNGIPVECVLGDVTDVESVKRAVQACDWVIHAAASLGDAKLDMDRQWQVNVEGTRYAVQACPRAQRQAITAYQLRGRSRGPGGPSTPGK